MLARSEKQPRAANYSQAERHMRVFTPLGKDVLLLVGFQGEEAISHLYRFEVEVRAENRTEVAFDKLLGQKVAVDLILANGKRRYFHGLCSRVTQGPQDQTFTTYWLEIVPPLWLLTKRAQSRIFQHLTVPEILKRVLEGLNVSYEIRGDFHPRDYCVQYRETDFAFASRLLEEEGLFYFFKHSADGVKMVVANTPQSHRPLPEAGTLIYDELKGGRRHEDRIYSWRKVQELRSSQYTLWDHCFELPHRHLEASRGILDSVPAGAVTHRQRLPPNRNLEVYDYPGAYAQRFDGIDRNGGEQPADLQQIYEDNQRTVAIRMQQEAVQGLFTEGRSGCRQLTCGYRFTLTRHFNANGDYLLTGVRHQARLHADYRSGGGAQYKYTNAFTCIPLGQPFRPQRTTPRPVVQGTQTAVVVGPAGEEIFVDKYGRVKVQFHWDRQGKFDSDSSCWVRVTQAWAGKRWGAHFWPRIGQEVIVDFLEGDPDRPIVVGTVYNADHLPPYDLPANKTQSGLKTRSSLTGTPENFNELRFEDKKDVEEIYFHAEKDFNRVVENNDTLRVGFEKKDKGDQAIEIFNNQVLRVGAGQGEASDGSQAIEVWKNRSEVVRTGDETVVIEKGNRTHVVKQNDTLVVQSGNRVELIEKGSSTTQAEQFIELRVGDNFIRIDQTGITLQGTLIQMQGTALVQITAPLLQTDAVLANQGAIVSVNEAVVMDVAGVITWVEGMALLNLDGGYTMLGPPKSPARRAALACAHAVVSAAPGVVIPTVKSAVVGEPLAGAIIGVPLSLAGAAWGIRKARQTYQAGKTAALAGQTLPPEKLTKGGVGWDVAKTGAPVLPGAFRGNINEIMHPHEEEHARTEAGHDDEDKR